MLLLHLQQKLLSLLLLLFLWTVRFLVVVARVSLLLTWTLIDDFDDFQSAPSPVAAAPTPVTVPAAKPAVNVFDMLNKASPAPTTPAFGATPSFGATPGFGTAPNYSAAPNYSSTPIQPARPNYGHSSSGSLSVMSPSSTTSARPLATATAPAAPKASGNFDDLWNMSVGSSTTSASTAKASSVGGAQKSIKDLEKEKASAGMWGATAKPGGAAAPASSGAFGGFGSGGDDLLL